MSTIFGYLISLWEDIKAALGLYNPAKRDEADLESEMEYIDDSDYPAPAVQEKDLEAMDDDEFEALGEQLEAQIAEETAAEMKSLEDHGITFEQYRENHLADVRDGIVMRLPDYVLKRRYNGDWSGGLHASEMFRDQSEARNPIPASLNPRED
jgi:hypothetical protein